jgi:hypothetical protein
MIYRITIVATQQHSFICEIQVQKPHEILDINAVIAPGLGPLVDKCGPGTTTAFQGTNVGRFNVDALRFRHHWL